MREIKFRAFHKKQGMKECTGITWYYGSPVPTFASVGRAEMGIEGEWTLMQFTGLKDKNEKEIYEGDILKGIAHEAIYAQNKRTEEILGEVKYSAPEFYYSVKEYRFRGHPNMKNMEVIGNIYTTPELLNQQ